MFASLGLTDLWASFERPAARLRHYRRVRSKPYKSQQSLRETFHPPQVADINPTGSVQSPPTRWRQSPQIKIIVPRNGSSPQVVAQTDSVKKNTHRIGF
jgi:hypothetical protein